VLQLRGLQIFSGTGTVPFFGTSGQRRYRRRGVLREPAATNSLLHSADLSNAAYIKSGTSTVTSNTQLAPDGTVTMDRYNSTAITDIISQTLTLGGTTTRGFAFVFYAPGSTETSATMRIQWVTGGVTQNVNLAFNPSTGAAGAATATGATLGVSGIEDLGAGYFRAYIVGTGTDAANTQVQSQVVMNTAARNITMWGWQNEASRITSYVATTTAAVTRTVDTGLISSITTDIFTNAAEASLYTEAMAPSWSINQPSGNTELASVQNAAGTAWWRHRFQCSAVTPVADVGTSTGWDSTNSNITALTVTRMASRMRGADMAFYKDGTLIQATAAFTMPVGLDRIEVGYGSGLVGQGPSWLQRVTLWPRGLTNTELDSLTTTGPGAIDYDSGWVNAARLSLLSELQDTRWGWKHDVQFYLSSPPITKFFTLLLRDTGNADRMQIGRLFMATYSLQPAVNASYGMQDGYVDFSTNTQAISGTRWCTPQQRAKSVALDLDALTEAEGAKAHELVSSVGTCEEVYFMFDPADPAKAQRFGFLGQMQKLNPLKFPRMANRALAVELLQKV
jgi:hypothetical protein